VARGQRPQRFFGLRQRLDRVAQHVAAGSSTWRMTLAGTLPSVISIAVSIIDNVKPFTPNP